MIIYLSLQVNIVEALDLLTHSKAIIAVITPYKAQKIFIEGRLKLKGMKANWRVQTIDASQGTTNTCRGSTLLSTHYFSACGIVFCFLFVACLQCFQAVKQTM